MIVDIAYVGNCVWQEVVYSWHNKARIAVNYWMSYLLPNLSWICFKLVWTYGIVVFKIVYSSKINKNGNGT